MKERKRLPRLRRKSARKSGSTLQGRGNRHAWLFFLSSLVGVTVFIKLPFLDIMRRSFYDAVGKHFAGMKNYSTVWSNQTFRLAVSNILRFLAVYLPLLLLVLFVLALFVYRGDTKHGVFRTSLVSPMTIPVASMVLVWETIFCPDEVLNQFLLGISSQAWELNWVRGEAPFGMLTVTYLQENAGYDIPLWLAGMSAIPESLYEAARMDGAEGFDNLRYITIPMLRGTFGLVLVLPVVNSFRTYREVYLLAGSYPFDTIYLIPHLFSSRSLKLDVQKTSTATVMMTTVSVILALTASWRRSRVRKGIRRRRRRRVGGRAG